MPRGLDTNILVYALIAQDENKRRVAEKILSDAIERPYDYLVSTQVLAETIYVVSRKVPEVLEEAIRLIRLLSITFRVVHYTHLEVLQASKCFSALLLGSPACIYPLQQRSQGDSYGGREAL